MALGPNQGRYRTRVGPRPEIARVRALLARRSLKPQLNQIRTWVRQGRTDAWIAHQLEVSVSDIRGFKREHDLAPDGANGDDAAAAAATDEPDLRAEDDALVAAALEAEEEEAPEPEDEPDDGNDDADGAGEQKTASRRRRGRRGGRGRKRKSKQLEGTFDHGEEGYGLWLDPSVQDDPVYAEHWAG